MIRSGACIMGTLLFAASFSVNALTSNDFDPAILLSGKKKPQRLIHWPQRPAKCVIIRIVQRGRMKNPTFSVNASGEISGAYKICTKSILIVINC